ncbi:MAG TPA: hypothetical protein VJT49_19115 [Amycolatopsis sp.]|uniref:hypothetical protein n=1 Tax=Amycolatopsis sp. TaxID=37632 RepID=UPI002B46C06D|nr:hypothetical protein [Amycolatopsis sp.]HKS47178.1 hypothetical protein [Amycolatopsis sp.]
MDGHDGRGGDASGTWAHADQDRRLGAPVDGSDQVNVLVRAALTFSKLCPVDEKARVLIPDCIAGQLSSPTSLLPRRGRGEGGFAGLAQRPCHAMRGIFPTRIHGRKQVSELFSRFPLMVRASGWAVSGGDAVSAGPGSCFRFPSLADELGDRLLAGLRGGRAGGPVKDF